MAVIADTFDSNNPPASPEKVEPTAEDLALARSLFGGAAEFGDSPGHDFHGNQWTAQVGSDLSKVSVVKGVSISELTKYATHQKSNAKSTSLPHLVVGPGRRPLAVLVDGNHALAAAKERGDKTISVIVDRSPQSVRQHILGTENQLSEDLNRSLTASAEFGDQAGHDFRGNQYTGPFFGDSVVGRVGFLVDGKAGYTRTHGLGEPSTKNWAKIAANPENGARIAHDYSDLPMRSPDAIPAYNALRDEVGEQYKYLTQELGVKVDMVGHDPYKNVDELRRDLIENKHLSVLSTESTGPHPYFSNTQNDQFRAVHDAFGHAAIGRGFDRNGEEAAFQSHAQMFSPLATRALATETRGQNNELIYGENAGQFPPQKLALLPTEDSIVAALLASAQLLSADGDNLFDITHSHHVSLGRSLHARAEEFGDSDGHPFHGNQYTGGMGGLKDLNLDKPGTQVIGHHATDTTSAHQIEQVGFDPMATGGAGSMFGRGTYFSLDSESGRETQLYIGGDHFTAEVTLGNPFVIKGEDAYNGKYNIAAKLGEDQDKFTERVLKVEMADEEEDRPEATALTALAKEKGYDSIVVRSNTTENADIYGVDQVVVFDKNQIEIKDHLSDPDWYENYRPVGGKITPTVQGSALTGTREVELLSVPNFLDRIGKPITASIQLELGDESGHPFHGNQYTGPLTSRIAEEGGMTYDPHTGTEPTDGYIVAKDLPSTFIPTEAFLSDETRAKEALARFVDEHAAEYDDPTSMIGIWRDDNPEHDEVVLDVVEQFMDYDEAVQAGVDRNQQAGWDIVQGKTFPTGGTGR